MAFDTIDELLKSKNPNALVKPVDPDDPDAKDKDKDDDAEDVVRPFGNTPIDPLTGNPMYGSGRSTGLRATIGDKHSGHAAVILKHSFEDGKVKLFEDSKGLAERTEMLVDKGKVVVYKDYDVPGGMARYKKIEVYSVDSELLGTLKLYPRDRTNPRPVYRFFYDQTEIGSGNGDIALFVAQELVGRNIQSRSGVGTSIDGEIITTIKGILHNKR